MSTVAEFQRKAATYIPRLLQEFPQFNVLDGCAIFGNLWAESHATAIQEINPWGRGPGGFGWAQWTGPRRRDFEDYCRWKNLRTTEDEANFGFLVHELKGTEKKAIPALVRAKTLYAKTRAFEDAFERAGIKNYEGRFRGAMLALRGYEDVHGDSWVQESGGMIPPKKPIETKREQGLWGVIFSVIAGMIAQATGLGAPDPGATGAAGVDWGTLGPLIAAGLSALWSWYGQRNAAQPIAGTPLAKELEMMRENYRQGAPAVSGEPIEAAPRKLAPTLMTAEDLVEIVDTAPHRTVREAANRIEELVRGLPDFKPSRERARTYQGGEPVSR